jgi:hypothetical protein
MSDVAFWGPNDEPALRGFREALRAEWQRSQRDLPVQLHKSA